MSASDEFFDHSGSQYTQLRLDAVCRAVDILQD